MMTIFKEYLKRGAPLLLIALLASPLAAKPSAFSSEQVRSVWIAAVLKDHCADVFPAVSAAAETKNTFALEIEAAMYDRGCGVVQNMGLATKLYADALAHGANDGLARGYVNLYGSNPSETQGIARLTEAQKAGNPLAAYDLYFYYAHRLRDQSDDVPAFHWASLAARSGDAVASADLASFYLSGTGVQQDISLGHQYADKGVSANIPQAFNVVGYYMLIGGSGYTKDRAQGISLLRKAIALGLSRAKMTLAIYADKTDYDEGRLTESETNAFALEADQLLKPKKYYDFNLAEYWYIGAGRSVPDCARAMPLLLEVADMSYYEPDYDISYCYGYGDGVTENDELSYKYLKLAAEKGSPNAIAVLKSDASDQPGTAYHDRWRDYEGYHWNELHPMSGPVAPH